MPGFREQPDWAADAWDATAAQVDAVLSCSVARAHGYVRYAMAMRDRLPEAGKAFAASDIDYRAFQTIVFRTDLITDHEALARVDARVAVQVSRRRSLTRAGLAAAVDRVVAAGDRDALRRAAKAVEDRYVDVVADWSGMAWMEGRLFAAAGQALDRRLAEWPAPYVTVIRGPYGSAAPMRSGRWLGGPGGWCAAAARPIARWQAHRRAPAMWSSISLPTKVQWRAPAPPRASCPGSRG